ncbi:hypothetical protein H9P43_005916 [Blastocladiella emersonii ATCC 22665]|nr:hypothetical protein H9P43_005916 [Blastocladiella emersonii ATCC 22665]
MSPNGSVPVPPLADPASPVHAPPPPPAAEQPAAHPSHHQGHAPPRKASSVVVPMSTATASAKSLPDGGAGAGAGGAAGRTSDGVGVASTVHSQSTASLHRGTTYQVDFNRPDSTLHLEYRYPTNYIRTTKYTVISFLPLNLFGQFRRLSNLYFLLGAIFSMVGDTAVSTLAQVAPLIFVLTVTAVKDGIEDYARYKADVSANLQPSYVVRNGERVEVQTKTLRPGDIVSLSKGDKVPADLILLSTSYEDGNCFIETSELDGETSLKRRNALPETMHANTLEELSKLSGRIQCELPNENLVKFEGRLLMERDDAEKVFPLTMSQLLLRGSYLRNTDAAFGVVVYAGAETKIFKNLKQSGLKFSSMERSLNKIVLAAFVYNMVMLFVSVCLETPMTMYIERSVWYMLPAAATPSYGFGHYFNSFMTYFVLFSYTIPVSLFVIIEGVRVLQRQFMVWDDQLKCPRGRPMRVNNSNLNEDLGGVHYVFSDKTGTMTRNEMVLTCLCTGPLVYRVRAIKSIAKDPALARLVRCILLCNNAMPVETKRPPPGTPAAATHGATPGTDLGRGVSLPPVDVNEHGAHIDYESQSPDEIALLLGIRKHAYLKQRKKASVVVVENGVEQEIRILDMLEFNSDRKRMSVIVRERDGSIVVYSKGADNIMFPRLRGSEVTLGDDVRLAVEEQLHLFSEDGLRTLVFTAKPMSEDEYLDFKRRYDDAARSLVDREARLERAADMAERGLDLLGCSAIEDRLQDRVPETIDFLLRCGIKVWMLTGDKQETAVNIAHSCKLIRPEMMLLHLDSVTPGAIADQLTANLALVKTNAPKKTEFALTVTGESLSVLFDNAPQGFLALANQCASVICCRVTPLQKALVVRLVKRELGVLTLSIGDGANDVSMIQEADIGVGIEGMEGAQAVRAADYAIVEFKALARLLSVHGRYSMLRLSNLVLYSFYKNISFISTQFFYGLCNAWSGGPLYNGSFLPNWNVLFTFLPPFLYAFMEKDVGEGVLVRHPQLYKSTRDSTYFWSTRNAVMWFLSCVWHTAVSFLGCLLLFWDSPSLDSSGRMPDLDSFQWFNAIVILGIVTLRIMLMSHHWTLIAVLGVVLSFLLYIATLGALSVLTSINTSVKGYMAQDDLPYGLPTQIHGMAAYWFVLILAPITAVLPDAVVSYFKVQEYPSDRDILREQAFLERKIMGKESYSVMPSNGGDQSAAPTMISVSVVPTKPHAAAAAGSAPPALAPGALTTGLLLGGGGSQQQQPPQQPPPTPQGGGGGGGGGGPPGVDSEKSGRVPPSLNGETPSAAAVAAASGRPRPGEPPASPSPAAAQGGGGARAGPGV